MYSMVMRTSHGVPCAREVALWMDNVPRLHTPRIIACSAGYSADSHCTAHIERPGTLSLRQNDEWLVPSPHTMTDAVVLHAAPYPVVNGRLAPLHFAGITNVGDLRPFYNLLPGRSGKHIILQLGLFRLWRQLWRNFGSASEAHGAVVVPRTSVARST